VIGRIFVIVFALLGLAVCEEFPANPLTDKQKASIYEQAKLSPGARQMGLGCAFFANVPLLTMVSGVNIADGSVASREFISRIYGLRNGDFQFASAFDREMFFKLFHIPSKRVDVYYRAASRAELLVDAEEIVNRDLMAALDRGSFVSLRFLGEFGGPHNVLLIAYRAGKYYYHEPRTGRIVESAPAELASKILTISKVRSKTKTRYFSSYHLVALPVPAKPNRDFTTPLDFPRELALELTGKEERLIATMLTRADDGSGITSSFPEIDFATKRKGDVSHIDNDLDVASLYGVYSISKLALHSHHSGKRDSLPVWLMDGEPLAMIAYADGSEARLTFFDGKNRSVFSLTDALVAFKKSGCYLGYLALPQS
jgi:hypothetical protein